MLTEQLCTCPKCIEARASKGLSDCYKAQLAMNVHYIRSWSMPGNYIFGS